MSLSLFLAAGTAPNGQTLPANAQALLDFMAQYVSIDGQDSFNGVNFGPSTPAPENRGYPWFKTDADYNPIGFYSWNGSAWVAIPTVIATGTTSQRPLSPATGTVFFDTTINVELTFERGQWRTSSGSPGDCKFVMALTEAAALTQNPGWAVDTAAYGRVIGGAGTGAGLTARAVGSTLGEEAHILAVNEMPAHTHTTSLANARADANSYAGDGGLSGHSPPGAAGSSTPQSSSTGNDAAHNTMQPSIFRVPLYKQ